MSKLKNTECNNSNPECCLCEYCERIVVNIEFKFQFKDVLEKYKNSL